MAPACNVRLIRHDLSTIWCELTLSIRTAAPSDVENDLNVVPPSQLKQGGNKNGKSDNNVGSNESAASSESVQEEKELLLCFRPIREGKAVGEELRFIPKASVSDKTDGSNDSPASSDTLKVASPTEGSSSNNATAKGEAKKESSSSTEAPSTETQAATAPPAPSPSRKNRPPKKRKFENDAQEIDPSKKSRDAEAQVDEKSAIESMMELAKTSL
jgi:hypothetical protein